MVKKQKSTKLKGKWSNLLREPPKEPKPESSGAELDALGLLDEETTFKKVNFRRLLGEEERDYSLTAEDKLLKAAKVLERMVVQDLNTEVTFG